VGESWPIAAARELAEEAGLTAPLVDHAPVVYEDDQTRCVGRVFSARHGGPPTFVDGEVVDHAWVAIDEVRSWARSRELCDDSAAVVLPFVVEQLGALT
jgi:8-oxo-dGTP pyrophosphatase MutT (NUDIX family)